MKPLTLSLVITLAALTGALRAEQAPDKPVPSAIRIATFDVDATPPLGAAMAYDPVKRLDELTLRCRGIVILGAGKPIVLCAVDWIGIANEGHDQFRERLADAAGTSRERVAVHTLHQHDAPGCDFTAERLIRELGLKDFGRFDGGFHREVLQRAAKAVQAGIAAAQPATHYGWGVAKVKEVASNRRILGPDGKVRAVRYTATKDAALRAEPEGVIDPEVSLLSFWNAERPIALLSYYDCRVLHMPGELFVEYQLAAKKLRPDLHVALAAYGDYGPAYIGTTVAYAEGGYETGPRASNVAPEVEPVLMDAIKRLLGAK